MSLGLSPEFRQQVTDQLQAGENNGCEIKIAPETKRIVVEGLGSNVAGYIDKGFQTLIGYTVITDFARGTITIEPSQARLDAAGRPTMHDDPNLVTRLAAWKSSEPHITIRFE